MVDVFADYMIVAASLMLSNMSRQGDPPSNAIRRNYHGTQDGLRLQMAKKIWERTKSNGKGGVSFTKFCKKKNIPTSTLWNETNGKCVSHKRGRRNRCDELLHCKCDSISEVSFSQEKIDGSLISYIFEYWKQKEILQRTSSHPKRKRHFFVGPQFCQLLEEGGLSPTSLGGWPSAVDTSSYNAGTIHVMVNVAKRHWIYILVDISRREMKAYNSQKYGSNRNHHAQEEVRKVEYKYMLKIAQFICSLEAEANKDKKGGGKADSKIGEWNFVVVKGLPSQTNHRDCGVFATFYADCMRNQFTIKNQLTDDEITLYRRKMHKYAVKGMQCGKKKKIECKQKDIIEIDSD